MDKLALKIPDLKPGDGQLEINTSTGVEKNFPTGSTSLGTIISSAFEVVFYIAIFLSFFWFVWGAFEYIMAEGKKEALAKARSRMQWSLVGVIILVAMFAVGQFAPYIFPETGYSSNLIRIEKLTEPKVP